MTSFVCKFASLVTLVACNANESKTLPGSSSSVGATAFNAGTMFRQIQSGMASDSGFLAKVAAVNSGSFSRYYADAAVTGDMPKALDREFGSIAKLMSATGVSTSAITLSEIDHGLSAYHALQGNDVNAVTLDRRCIAHQARGIRVPSQLESGPSRRSAGFAGFGYAGNLP